MILYVSFQSDIRLRNYQWEKRSCRGKIEKKWEKNTDENSSPLMLLPVDHLMATDCNDDRSCQYSVLPNLWCNAVTFTICRTAWSKNEGGFEFHRHENKKINKILQKSCNVLATCLKHTVSYFLIQNYVKNIIFWRFS